MNALSSRSSARPAFANAAQANSGRRGLIRARSSNRDAQSFNSDALSVLARRIAQQQQQQKAEQARRSRPQLPMGGALMFDEMTADHQLITRCGKGLARGVQRWRRRRACLVCSGVVLPRLTFVVSLPARCSHHRWHEQAWQSLRDATQAGGSLE